MYKNIHSVLYVFCMCSYTDNVKPGERVTVVGREGVFRPSTFQANVWHTNKVMELVLNTPRYVLILQNL
jgi:hypothetical protein